MKPPESSEIFETSTSKYWFVDDLLYVISKKGEYPDEETERKQLNEFRKLLAGRKVCAIMDVSDANPSSRERRERNTAILPELFKAIAFVIKSPVARMLAHLYLGIQSPPFPFKLCTNEDEAQEWIKQYNK